MLWQDVLEAIINKRPNDASCPYCKHRPLTIEEIAADTDIIAFLRAGVPAELTRAAS